MIDSCYVIYDLIRQSKKRCGSYGEYLNYYQTQLKPNGYGTRYMFSEIKRRQYIYHLRLVREGCTNER